MSEYSEPSSVDRASRERSLPTEQLQQDEHPLMGTQGAPSKPI